jgi:hypothetical protein
MHILLKAIQPQQPNHSHSDAVLQCNYDNNYYGDQLCQVVRGDNAPANKGAK